MYIYMNKYILRRCEVSTQADCRLLSQSRNALLQPSSPME